MSGRLGLVTSACRALARLPLQRSCAMAAHLATLSRAACNQVAARQPASPCLAAHPAAAAAALPPCHRRGFVAAAASSGPSSSSSLSSSWNSSSRSCSARRMHDWRAVAAGGGAAAEAAPQLAAPPQTKTSGAYGMQLPAGGKRCVACCCALQLTGCGALKLHARCWMVRGCWHMKRVLGRLLVASVWHPALSAARHCKVLQHDPHGRHGAALPLALCVFGRAPPAQCSRHVCVCRLAAGRARVACCCRRAALCYAARPQHGMTSMPWHRITHARVAAVVG